ncbi:MAG TPA: aminotransferase class III-fold pyridoxal phosphate-dependent enzyme [Acidimicrobiales bacterium]|nr:aminotransferase class III-fold pyridoxal phosphate-dependent enzyme [Acidimicrobiales bacterium]
MEPTPTAPRDKGRPPAQLHPYASPAAPASAYLSIVSGEGARVVDDQGRSYVDALASLWYCQVGHGRGEIARAISDQAATLAGFHTFDRFANPPTDRLCEELSDLAPMPGARVFLTSGGSEAVETAIKLARAAHARAGDPARSVVVSRRPSYHGVTYGAMSATGLPANQEGFGPLLADVVQVGRDDLPGLEALLEDGDAPGGPLGPRLAAVIAEPVVGAGGVYPPSPGYLGGLRRVCDRHGAFLILDEVICGFGRLGTWWGAEHYGVRPDLVTFAKGVTSGYQPVGGVLVGESARGPLEADPSFVLRHGNTYAGHPTGSAAALANLAILASEGLLEAAGEMGARLGRGLSSLVDKDAALEARGDGAIWALGLGEGVDAVSVRDELLTRGVIARPVGASTLAFCPPLVITAQDLDHCVEAAGEALAAVAARR